MWRLWISGSPQDLIAFVNRLNQEGVTVYRRLSPRVLSACCKLPAKRALVFTSRWTRLRRPLQRQLGGRGGVPELVRHRARAHRTLASPAADSAGHQPPRHNDAGVVSPSSRLLSARPASPVSRCRCASWRGHFDRDLRRMRRALGFVQRVPDLGFREQVPGGNCFPCDHTPRRSVAPLHKRHRS